MSKFIIIIYVLKQKKNKLSMNKTSFKSVFQYEATFMYAIIKFYYH